MKKYTQIWLDGNDIKNKEDLVKFFKEKFNCPDYCGNNLDALHDCLSEVNEFTILFMAHTYKLYETDINTDSLIKMLYDVKRNNMYFNFYVFHRNK